MSLERETRRIVQLAESIFRPRFSATLGVDLVVADPWSRLDDLLKRLLAGSPSPEGEPLPSAEGSFAERPVPSAPIRVRAPSAPAEASPGPLAPSNAASRAAGSQLDVGSPEGVAPGPRGEPSRALEPARGVGAAPSIAPPGMPTDLSGPSARGAPSASPIPGEAAGPASPERPPLRPASAGNRLTVRSSPEGESPVRRAPARALDDADVPAPSPTPLRLTSTPQGLAALLQAHVVPVEGPAVAFDPLPRDAPAAPAFSPEDLPTASAPRVAPQLPAHVVPVEEPAPASEPLFLQAPRAPAFRPEDLLAGDASPVASQLLLDALLDRLEVRLREQSIRHFGLTGGDL